MKQTLTLLAALLLSAVGANARIITFSNGSFGTQYNAASPAVTNGDIIEIPSNVSVSVSPDFAPGANISIIVRGALSIANSRTFTLTAPSTISLASGATLSTGNGGSSLIIGSNTVQGASITRTGPGNYTSGGYSAGVPLGVVLTEFATSTNNGQVSIHFGAADEKAVQYYEVEHSIDGKNFNAIGLKVAAGNGSYNFNNVTATAGTNYYRIAISENGNVSYSATATAKVGKAMSFDPAIFPNPATTNITINANTAVDYMVTDMAGRVVTVGTFSANDVKNVNIAGLQKGNYSLKMIAGTESKAVSFVKIAD